MIKKVLGIKYNWWVKNNAEEVCSTIMVGDSVFDDKEDQNATVDHIDVSEDPVWIAHIYLDTGRYYTQGNLNRTYGEEL